MSKHMEQGHAHSRDDRHRLVWILDTPRTTGRSSAATNLFGARPILSNDGLDNIAHHQYRAGTYTPLDNLLTPVWTCITERTVPRHLSANVVTAFGGSFCLASYLLTWHYTPNFDQEDRVPNWAHAVNSFCLLAYYAMDCMDGIQARRTDTSSPLGQLWDHGIDGLCLLSHASMTMAWLPFRSNSGETNDENETRWLLSIQVALQLSWFAAQWEEYHTGVLVHSTAGLVGITEFTYGMAFLTLGNAWIVDPVSFYSIPLGDIFHSNVGLLHRVRLDNSYLMSLTDASVAELQLKHLLAFGWYGVAGLWILISVARVMSAHSSRISARRGILALTQLASPAIVSVSTLVCLPASVLERDTRYILLATGLALCLLSIKLIVFGMAKQSYAVFQVDCLPLLGAIFLSQRFDDQPVGIRSYSAGRTRLLWQITCVWYLLRVCCWTRAVVDQISDKLDVSLFRIKKENKSAPILRTTPKKK